MYTLNGIDPRDGIVEYHFAMFVPNGKHRALAREQSAGKNPRNVFFDRMTLFTREQTTAALEAAGFEVTHEEEGLMGRGMYFAVRPTSETA